MKSLTFVPGVLLKPEAEEYMYMDLAMTFGKQPQMTSLNESTVAQNLNALDLLKYTFLDCVINHLSSDMYG